MDGSPALSSLSTFLATRVRSLGAFLIRGDMVCATATIVGIALAVWALQLLALGLSALYDPASIATALNLDFALTTAIVSAAILVAAALRGRRTRPGRASAIDRGDTRRAARTDVRAAVVFGLGVLAVAFVLFAVTVVSVLSGPGEGILSDIGAIALYMCIPVALGGVLSLVVTGVLALLRRWRRSLSS